EEIVKKSQQIFYYAGKDIKAKVLMKLISKSGKKRIRELTMLRLNQSHGGEQKYYMYFHRPADVRQMTFMVWKYLGKNDDRWLYVPSIKLVRRIAANDKNSSFVGSDFTYEDVSGREVSEDTHTLNGEEALNGKSVYVVESTPKQEKSAYYSRKVSWIDKETFLPVKEEYYDKRGDLLKTFSADKTESVEGIPTIVQRTMANVQNGHRTVVTFEAVNYNVGLKDNTFSERYLRSAPREWIK
ncbi:MAG: outer membrane lipoprotein-sorting protein, partial [bacterium]